MFSGSIKIKEETGEKPATEPRSPGTRELLTTDPGTSTIESRQRTLQLSTEQPAPENDVDTGTPTIIFRARRLVQDHRISLRRDREPTPSTSSHVEPPQPILVPDEDSAEDDEDLDLQSAITNSLTLPEVLVTDDQFETEMALNHGEAEPTIELQTRSTATSQQPTSQQQLASALKSLAENVIGGVDDGFLKIIVRRSSALEDAIRNISRAQTRLFQPLQVRFIGESAVDEGGPSRELASLVVTQLLSSSYVEGPEHNKNFKHNFKHYSTRSYLHLGQLTAVLILQGGQGLPVFCRSVTEYLMMGKIINSDVDLPESLRTAFKQLQDKPGGDIGMHIDELWPQRFEEGYTLPSTKITRENVPEIVQAMVAHHVIQPQKMALDQFVQGLQIGGVFQALQEHTTEAMGLFRGGATSLTMDYLENLVIFDYSNIDEGSNAATVAQGIEQGWVLLLQAAESGEAKFQFEETAQNISLADLLQWFTGATRIPAVGFRKKIDLYFDKDACLPKVNPCSMDAYFPLLPVFQDPERFMRQLVEWVVCSRGFGLL